MGAIVIACYRPKPGRAAELYALVREHVPTLRRQGLVTGRVPVAMLASDGTVLEVFEWVSEEASGRAHGDPVVQKLWQRFEELCDFLPPAQVPGIDAPFPHFEPLT